MTGFDVGKNFDRGGDAGGGNHGDENLWGYGVPVLIPGERANLYLASRTMSRKAVELGFGTNLCDEKPHD